MSNTVQQQYTGKHRIDKWPVDDLGASLDARKQIERHLRLNVFCGDHYAPEDGAR